MTDGQDIDEIVAAFRRYAEQKQAEKEQAAKEAQRAAQEASQAAERREAAIAALPVTSGFNYEGHSITRYAGYVSGDAVVEEVEGEQRYRAHGSACRDESQSAGQDEGGRPRIGVQRGDRPRLRLPAGRPGAGAMGTGKTTYLPDLFGVVANGTAVVIEARPPVKSPFPFELLGRRVV